MSSISLRLPESRQSSLISRSLVPRGKRSENFPSSSPSSSACSSSGGRTEIVSCIWPASRPLVAKLYFVGHAVEISSPVILSLITSTPSMLSTTFASVSLAAWTVTPTDVLDIIITNEGATNQRLRQGRNTIPQLGHQYLPGC